MRYRSEADFTYGLRLGVKKGTDISNYPFLHAGCNVFVLWESCWLVVGCVLCISSRIIWMTYMCPWCGLYCIHTGILLCLIVGSLWCAGLTAEVMRAVYDSECAFVQSVFYMRCGIGSWLLHCGNYCTAGTFWGIDGMRNLVSCLEVWHVSIDTEGPAFWIWYGTRVF